MEIQEIIEKLVGPIDPVGQTQADNKRFENLKVMTGLVYDLLNEIKFVSRSKISYEDSVKKAGKYADQFLTGIGEEFSKQD